MIAIRSLTVFPFAAAVTTLRVAGVGCHSTENANVKDS